MHGDNPLDGSLSALMIDVRRYRAGEEETLRRICIDTTLRINVDDYGPELVRIWAARLDNKKKWKAHVAGKNPLVARCGDEIVGFAEFDAGGRIGAFYCRHDWQRRGVGSALLRRIETEANALDLASITVDSSPSAARFFESRGFDTIRKNEVFTDGKPSSSLLLVKSTGQKRTCAVRREAG